MLTSNGDIKMPFSIGSLKHMRFVALADKRYGQPPASVYSGIRRSAYRIRQRALLSHRNVLTQQPTKMEVTPRAPVYAF